MYPYSTVCITGNEFLDKGVSFSICMAPTAMQPSLGDVELLLQYNFLPLNNKFPWIIPNSFQPLPVAVIKVGIAWVRKTAPCTSTRQQLFLVLWHTTPQRWQPTELFHFRACVSCLKSQSWSEALLFALFWQRENQARLAAEQVIK